MHEGPTVTKRIAIIGAGPAGLIAAIAAAQSGAEVTVFEQLTGCGARLQASGGGRCNLTNTLEPEAFMAKFGRNGRFVQPALNAMDSSALRTFLGEMSVATYAEGLAVYPVSNRATDVLEALLARCDELGVTVRAGRKVSQLLVHQGRVTGLEHDDGQSPADAVVLATGGKSYPTLGGTGSGYNLVAAIGHHVVTPIPALVPLLTTETWPRQCAGTSLPDARVWIDLKGQPKAGKSGAVLFTHTGLSGPAVLDLSGDVSALMNQQSTVPIQLSCLPETATQWRARMDNWQRNLGKRHLRTLVGEHMPAALATILCSMAGASDDLRAAYVPASVREHLADLLTALPLTVRSTEGFSKAMVTRGGVSLREVRPETLESRLVCGLFFAGEVLDLDGPCGGFNLQWAFSSGYLAGLSAAGKDG